MSKPTPFVAHEEHDLRRRRLARWPISIAAGVRVDEYLTGVRQQIEEREAEQRAVGPHRREIVHVPRRSGGR